MNRKTYQAVLFASIMLVVMAAALMIEQRVTSGTWWSWDQVLHHENFALVMVSFAIGMLVILQLTMRKRRGKRR